MTGFEAHLLGGQKIRLASWTFLNMEHPLKGTIGCHSMFQGCKIMGFMGHIGSALDDLGLDVRNDKTKRGPDV